MGLKIGGESDLNKITRKFFKDQARNVGLGKAIALEHFDSMNNKFEKCLIDSAEELESEGIQNAKEIALEILEKKLCNISKT